MQDITELERRISAALERIGTGLSGLAAPQSAAGTEPAADPGEVATLRAELEAEREVTAQLEERVRAGKERSDSRSSALEQEVEGLRAQVAGLEADRQRWKAVNDQLREINAALREANEAGIADAELIDRAMRAELDALKRARDSDRAEMDEILAELRPILEESAHA